jgi:hypothetical protein
MAWTERGSAYEVDWSGVAWRLDVRAARPGLMCASLGVGPLLALEGVAESGRSAPLALGGATLVHVESTPRRVVASYRPLGWGALHVRAAWSVLGSAAMGLEIEVQARSVGVLHAVEMRVVSTVAALGAAGGHRSVTPRDARSAALSYDGRETDLAALTTGPPGEALGPWLAPRSAWSGMTYVELAHPDDVSRRIHEGKLPFATTRYGVFGHDLEKGIVLRARFQGVWLSKSVAATESERRWLEFLSAPPPLAR